MKNITALSTLQRGHILHTPSTGRLFLVRTVSISAVVGHYVNAGGYRPKRAKRWVDLPAARVLAEFQLYIPCWWSLECPDQGTETVLHTDFGAMFACPAHATDHRDWQQACADIPRGQWPREPEPDCMCLGEEEPRYRHDRVDYCPSHGTPLRRGHELGQSITANYTTLGIDTTDEHRLRRAAQ